MPVCLYACMSVYNISVCMYVCLSVRAYAGILVYVICTHARMHVPYVCHMYVCRYVIDYNQWNITK